jgi:hypothetical protein
MAKQNLAGRFMARARARGFEKDKGDINGEEVKKELQDATKAGYRRALALWDQ